MIFLILGFASLLLLMYALGMFSRAQIASIKQFGVWTAAIGGLALTGMLFLTGRGPLALSALVLLGPMVWSWVAEGKRGAVPPPGGRQWGRRPGGAGEQRARPSSGLSRAEAYEVLGLKPGASAAEIRAAHHRLMRASHPDAGGSDWLAARINQARDTLLG
jgi:DnaJ family protein C protein 19